MDVALERNHANLTDRRLMAVRRAATPTSLATTSGQTPRIAFLFNAQLHQLLHGITTAHALADEWQADVHILAPSRGHLQSAAALVGPDTRLFFRRIGGPVCHVAARMIGAALPPKLMTLLSAAAMLNRYDAIALPERTSTILRRFGVTRPKLIHLDHGAGDRAAGFDRRIAHFDFALVAGEKQRRRMLADGLIRPGAHAIVGYPKFDAADRLTDRGWSPFVDRRPIILYNPHFSPSLGSLRRQGQEFIAAIAASGRFNLIVAPHIRLCDNRLGRVAVKRMLEPFEGLPHVHVDLGSPRLVDMSYTNLADIYVGDVSSQIYEFLRTPRPCLFLDPGVAAWESDPDFRHWHYGPVLAASDDWPAAVDAAFAEHAAYREAQRRGFAETFDMTESSSSERAAKAIAEFLGLQRRTGPLGKERL